MTGWFERRAEVLRTQGEHDLSDVMALCAKIQKIEEALRLNDAALGTLTPQKFSAIVAEA